MPSSSRRCDEARDLAGLEQLLDLDALLARERPVVRTRDLPLGQLVQAQRQPLREAAVVDEEDRRAVLLHEPQQLRIDRGPDGRLLGLTHVLQRHHDLQVELLRRAGVDQLDLARTGDEAADLLHRSLCCRQPDALERLVGESLEPLDREREVRAALRAGDCMHLVEDQRPDTLQVLARARCKHQVERLGGRDQDVRRVPQHLRALLLRCVAGADGNAQLGLEPREWPAQVALDVVVQRFQRRDVEEAQALPALCVEPVDSVEERRERLPGAGGRLDQGVLAARDGGPTELLGRSRLAERALEPGPRGRRKDV